MTVEPLAVTVGAGNSVVVNELPAQMSAGVATVAIVGLAMIVCVPPIELLPALFPVLTVKLVVLRSLTPRVRPLVADDATSIVIQK